MKHIFTMLLVFALLASVFLDDANAATIQLPKTGQTTCYSESGTKISCAGTGQDGDTLTGLAWPNPRFTANGDQTVTDNLTGLIWSKNANPASADKTWQGALDYIKILNSSNYQGHNDWRLPNIIELASLASKGQANNVTWLIEQGFSDVKFYYWSSSSAADVTSGALRVDMYGGGSDSFNKANKVYVWPVRGGQRDALTTLTLARTGQTSCYNASGLTRSCTSSGEDGELQMGASWPTPRFSDNSVTTATDLTVTDNMTGLIWSKNASPADGRRPWQEALDYIKTLNISNYQGHNDWRLPNRNELESLLNKQLSDQATWLNKQGFTNVQENLYWSSSTYASTSGYAWGDAWAVGMYVGNVGYFYKANVYYVWPVRGGLSGVPTFTKPGDCDNNGTVTIAEVQSGINMFLGLKTAEACVDQDGSGSVSIAEVQKVINSFLGL